MYGPEASEFVLSKRSTVVSISGEIGKRRLSRLLGRACSGSGDVSDVNLNAYHKK
jgi:hypothetical protein